MSFKIGNIEIKNRVVLAPMAGISNPAYIKICEEMGVGYAVTELISSEAIIRDNKKTLDMLVGIDDINIPVAIQIFGSNAKVMADAAKILVDKYNAKIIDINMGCPVPKVAVHSNAGSALMKDPDKVYDIVSAVVSKVDVPVTVKIRSGWDSNNVNALLISKIAEKAGASAITIHPRTRSQGYTGVSDWTIIKEIKKEVSIPVIGNGDIKSCYDAKKMIDETNCNAVMIGRGLLGNPWLIKDTINYLESGKEPEYVSAVEKINMIKKHLDYLIKLKPEKVAVLEMRSHVSWYMKGIPNAAKIRTKLNSTTTKQELYQILDDFIGGNYES